MKKRKHVVVIGCGFAGLSAVRALAEYIDLDVTVIDKKNHHLFQPLLYQVATGELNPDNIASPIRSLLSKYENVRVIRDEVTTVSLKEQIVYTDTEKFTYDYLVSACGAIHSYFGNEKWEDYAPGLKTLEGALEIRNRIFNAYEIAEKEDDPEISKQYLTFVVVGGGPTGVELAGAIADIAHLIILRDYRKINPELSKVILVEGGDRLLAPFSKKNSAKAQKFLEDKGVDVITSNHVSNIDENGVTIGKDLHIKAKTVLWGAGVKAVGVLGSNDIEHDRAGRVVVEMDLSLKDYPNVFVIGDEANSKDRHGNPHPGVATVALQQGHRAGRNIVREIEGKKRWNFFYFNRGKAATIGKNKAVLECWKFRTSGLMAWVMWLGIHIWFLAGLQNRIFVLMQWGWFYIFHRGEARIIMEKDWHSFPVAKKE